MIDLISRLPFRLPQALYTKGHAILNRSVLRVHGSDALKFLNGLTTNALADAKLGSGQYSLFLNPQGRVMYDTFIWKRGEDEYLVEADGRIGKDLFYHLKQFQLRSKIQIDDASSSFACKVGWNDNNDISLDAGLSMVDPRAGLKLTRQLIEGEPHEINNAHLYKTLRFSMGVPEGPTEVPRTQAIPLEYGFDLLGAINYHKGCYVGQELVARTHFRGTIRKRIMAVMIMEDPSGTFVPDHAHDYSRDLAGEELMSLEMANAETETTKSVGRMISTHGNLGMALVRLGSWMPEQIYYLPSCNLHVRPYIPPWWPNNDTT